MICLEIPSDLYIPPSETKRSEGTHLSSVIRSVAATVGILDMKWVEDLSLVDAKDITDPASILRILIGLAWEKYFIPTFLPNAEDHPGELCRQGIYMTPDARDVDVIITLGKRSWERRVREVKSTYKSCGRPGNKERIRNGLEPLSIDITKDWKWMTQCQGYCKALETRYAVMDVLYLCGDYTYPITPQHKTYQIEFEQEEIDMTWDVLVEYARYREQKDIEEGLA